MLGLQTPIQGRKLDALKLLSGEMLESNRIPVLFKLQGGESSFCHLATCSIPCLHGFLIDISKLLLNPSLEAIRHILDVFFWTEKEVL